MEFPFSIIKKNPNWNGCPQAYLVSLFVPYFLANFLHCSVHLLSESDSDSDVEILEQPPKRFRQMPVAVPVQRGVGLDLGSSSAAVGPAPAPAPVAPAPAPIPDCSICFEAVERRGDNYCLPCAHLFHLNCIVQWLRSNPICPVCRMRVPEEFLDDVLPGAVAAGAGAGAAYNPYDDETDEEFFAPLAAPGPALPPAALAARVVPFIPPLHDEDTEDEYPDPPVPMFSPTSPAYNPLDYY